MKAILQVLKTFNPKVLLYAAMAIAIAYALTSPAIAGPFFNFAFAGVVPGTDYVVPPDMMLIGVVIMFGLMAVTGLIALLVHRLRIASASQTLTPKPARTQAASKVRITKMVRTGRGSFGGYLIAWSQYKTAELIRRVRRPDVSLRPNFAVPTIAAGRGIITVIATKLTNVLVSIHFALRYAIVMIRWNAGKLVFGIVRLGLRTLIVMVKALGKLIRVVRMASIRLWTWLRPRAERFDSWLEVHYRAATAAISTKLMRYEAVQVLVGTFRSLFK